MKRLTCTEFGRPDGLIVETCPDPEPGPGEVVVRMTAANVAFVDRLIVRGGYQVKPPLPFTPGVVASGEVVAHAPDVRHLAEGTSVVVLKSDYGAWATHIVVPAHAVVPIPSNVPDEIAAASIEAYGTASYALEERGGLKAGEKALILGAGGAVGTAAVEVALHLDAEVIAHTSDPSYWEGALLRPHHVVNRAETPDLRQFMRDTFPEGVDVVLDPVGGPVSEPGLRSLAARGRFLVVGFAAGIASMPMNFILLRNRSVIGVEWATWITANPGHLARTLEVVLNRLARGVFNPPKPNLVTLDELPDVLNGPLPASGLVRTVVVPA